MTLTTDYAGLVAQVFPTLMIALLLEVRWLSRGPKWLAWINVVHHVVRAVAIVGAGVSTFTCLDIVGGRPSTDVHEWIVGITSASLLGAFSFMAGSLLGLESQKVGEILRENDRTRQESTDAG